MQRPLLPFAAILLGCIASPAWAVANVPQTITFAQPANATFASPAPTVALSATGGGSGNAVAFASQTPDVCSASGATAQVAAAGTCTILATQAGNATYDAAAPVTRSFTVNKGAQELEFFSGTSGTVESPFGVTASSSTPSGLPIVIASLTPDLCVTRGINGTSSVTAHHAGDCLLQATRAGNGNWNAATPVTVHIAIAKGTDVLTTVGTYGSQHVGEVVDSAVTPTRSSAPVRLASLTPSLCTTKDLSQKGGAITLMRTGECKFTISQDADDDYAASSIMRTIDAFNDGAQAVRNARTDYDGNGRNDLLWQRSDLLSGLWLMDGPTQVGGGLLFGADTGWYYLMSGDFNGDGHADILWMHNDGRVAMWLMNGFTQVGGAVILPPGTGYFPMTIGDFNGDGKQDILWGLSDGTIAVWLMDGTTQIGGGKLFGPGNAGWNPRFTADLNGDGKSDIVWEHFDGRTAVWLMDGITQIGGSVLLPGGTGWSARLAGDFNGDGKADILWEHPDGRSALWLMNGALQAGGGVLFGAGTGWRSARVGDLDGDGKADIVWQHMDGRVALWLMNGAAQASGALLVAADTGWIVRRVADFNGDGRSDIVMQNVDGSYSMWLMNGLTGSPAQIMPANTGWALMTQ